MRCTLPAPAPLCVADSLQTSLQSTPHAPSHPLHCHAVRPALCPRPHPSGQAAPPTGAGGGAERSKRTMASRSSEQRAGGVRGECVCVRGSNSWLWLLDRGRALLGDQQVHGAAMGHRPWPRLLHHLITSQRGAARRLIRMCTCWEAAASLLHWSGWQPPPLATRLSWCTAGRLIRLCTHWEAAASLLHWSGWQPPPLATRLSRCTAGRLVRGSAGPWLLRPGRGQAAGRDQPARADGVWQHRRPAGHLHSSCGWAVGGWGVGERM